MTDIPIPTGLTFKQIVDRAWLAFGVSDAMFARTEDEYASSILLLTGLMGQWPFDQLGFDAGTSPSAGERTGVEAKWLDAVALALATRIAPALNKQLTGDAKKDQRETYSRLCSVIGTEDRPEIDYANGTIRGRGHRWNHDGPFFPEVQ